MGVMLMAFLSKDLSFVMCVLFCFFFSPKLGSCGVDLWTDPEGWGRPVPSSVFLSVCPHCILDGLRRFRDSAAGGQCPGGLPGRKHAVSQAAEWELTRLSNTQWVREDRKNANSSRVRRSPRRGCWTGPLQFDFMLNLPTLSTLGTLKSWLD